MAANSVINHRWWSEETDQGKAAQLVASCDDVAAREHWRTKELLTSWRLYGGRKWPSLRQIGRMIRAGFDSSDTLVRYNLVASCVDTVTAKLSKNRPAPQFVTNGADWTVRRMTDKLNKFGRGVLYSSGVYEWFDDFIRDAAACGTAAVKFCEEDGKVKAERALLWELFVPPWEAERGRPMTLMQRTSVDREALLHRFGRGDGKAKRIAAIKASTAPSGVPDPSVGRPDDASDMVDVYEGWHLGCGDAEGRHVIAVSGGLLLDEPWTRKTFPFAFLRWETAPIGFWGIGIASQIAGLQYECNSVLQKIQLNTHLLANPTTYIRGVVGVPSAHLTNDIGAIVKLPPGAEMPERMVAPIMPPEVYAQVETYKAMAYERIGVSQMSAASVKPAGLDSGKALRDYHDIESERFLPPGRRVERFILDCVERCIDEAEAIPGFEVDTMDRRYNQRIKWKDIKVAREDYVLQCFPVSQLPQTPAARRQEVQELYQAGWLDEATAREMLNLPDLEENVSLELSTQNMVRKQIGLILDEEEYEPPEPSMHLELALKYANAVYLRERANGCPEEILEVLRAYRNQLTEMNVRAGKAMQAQEPQPGAAPNALPPEQGAGAVPAPMPMAA